MSLLFTPQIEKLEKKNCFCHKTHNFCFYFVFFSKSVTFYSNYDNYINIRSRKPSFSVRTFCIYLVNFNLLRDLVS